VKTIVIGGSGYRGRHVVAVLRERGHEVTVFSRGDAPGLPDGVGHVKGDYLDADWDSVLPGHDSVVFATGADDRTVPRRPAAPYFRERNVEALRRLLDAAKSTGVRRAVVHGSYLMALRLRPEQHPYVASRAAQQQVAAEAGLPCAVLQIPFVFGHTAHRPNMFAAALPWLRGTMKVPLLAPPGGTAVVSARAVGAATVNALGLDGAFPVAQANLTWRELISELAAGAGHPRPHQVRKLPPGLLSAGMRAATLVHAVRGREPGLRARTFAPVLRSEMFVDVCRPELGISADDLTKALHELRLDG
jgi:dihydroflavonol-4-reductase